MARKRIALIIPTNNTSLSLYTNNMRAARAWQSLLKLWGVSADILIAGNVSKATFNSQYDFGIVPFLAGTTSSQPVFSWISFATGDKPLYLCGYQVPQNTAGTPATGVLGLVGLDGNPTSARLAGRRAVWTQTGTKVHVGSWIGTVSGIVSALRVDESNPNLQVLLRPDPDLHPTAQHIYIARWHNRYFLPSLGVLGDSSPWVVPWIMVNEGVTPEWSRPWSADIDHVCSAGSITAPGWSFDLYLQSMQWLRTFCTNTGLVVQCGCTTNGNSSLSGTNTYLHRNARNANTQLAQIHQILLAEQDGSFPCAWHDHWWLVEETLWYANATTRTNAYGTFRDFSSPASFRAHWRGTLDEMRGMGFADSWCGRHRYLNFANNQFTDRYLRFLREETPVRAARFVTGSCLSGRNTRIMMSNPYSRNPLDRRYGIELIDSYDPLWSGNISYGTQPANREQIALADGYGTAGEDPELLFARVLGHRFGEIMWRTWLQRGGVVYHHNYEMSYEWPSTAVRVYQ
ncbi:MAG: hypothetical protein SNJ72_09110, partial [Fimbriimonadales bacterium]